MLTLTFPVRSLGSVLPADTDPAALSAWILERRGKETDLTSWHIETTLTDQLEFVDFPAAGGAFYADRILDACGNVVDGNVSYEFDPDFGMIQTDVSLVQARRKNCWWSIPAPSNLDVGDAYFGDPEEFKTALFETVSTLYRSMRDAGIPGHILTAERPDEIELEYFSGKRYLWAVLDEYLPAILEIQKDIVITKEGVSLLPDLLDSFEIRNVYIRDADPAALRSVLRHIDSENIQICGVGPEQERPAYWRDLASVSVESAE
ncbi:hypothetical protein [uncultured Methanocorpusculum sp.]|nr:hypothetical protein [uncultured Methanocorpusculum sp.]